MKKLLLIIAVLTAGFVSAQTQFEKGMTQGFALWKEGKSAEASAMFERIAAAEKNSWLPNYYVAFINTITAFQTKDKEKVSALLTKAQDAIDVEMVKDQNNVELLVLQALTYTAWIASDPMTNGMKLSGKVMELYAKAEAIAPENPRVVSGKADFEIGGAKFFGTDTKPMCARIDKAIGLFSTFKPETPFHPSWGLERALEIQKECNKK